MSLRTLRDGPVTTVILSRPERRNAVDGPTAAALEAAFRAFDADPEAHVAVLWGEGGNFCSGADLKAFAAGEGTHPLHLDAAADALGRPAPMGPTRLLLSKPVIAAVSGYAVAGGLELALWCDLRVADEDATFGVFCRRFGVPLIDGGTVRLPRLIGSGRALDMILTGRPVRADEALAWGLVDRVTPRGGCLEGARALARELAAHPQICLRADRRSAHLQWDLPLDAALLAEARGGLEAVRGEALAGARAFASGRGRHGDA